MFSSNCLAVPKITTVITWQVCGQLLNLLVVTFVGHFVCSVMFDSGLVIRTEILRFFSVSCLLYTCMYVIRLQEVFQGSFYFTLTIVRLPMTQANEQ